MLYKILFICLFTDIKFKWSRKMVSLLFHLRIQENSIHLLNAKWKIPQGIPESININFIFKLFCLKYYLFIYFLLYSDCDTLTHLLKASLGTGILTMPGAFRNSGLLGGIIATLIVSLICTHCTYVLVKCAHVLYSKTRKTQMSYAGTMEAALATGPKSLRKFASASKQFIQWSLFITYFGTCSAYAVIIAKSFREVFRHYVLPENATAIVIAQNLTEVGATEAVKKSLEITDLRIICAILLIPLILLMAVPNLKMLAPVSMVANVFMACSLGITFYYLVKNIGNISDIPRFVDIHSLPKSLSLVIFAIEAIGVVMPLENSMRTPQHFVGICGVLNKGMSTVTFIYILLGFLGFAAFPQSNNDLVTSDLDINLIPSQVCKILIGLAVFCTFALQFFVCLDIAWAEIKDRFQNRPVLANYVLRVVMVILCVALAIAVPTIGPFMGLIGAFCFSILGLIVPVFMETITYWDVGFGWCKWVAIKNIIITIFGILALVFGSSDAISSIIEVYK